MGVPYLSLLDVLEDTENKSDILKLGVVHPLPRKTIIKFLKEHDEIKILEELDDIIEKELKVIAYEENIDTEIIGKKDLEDWINKYTPDKVYKVMKKIWPDLLPDLDFAEYNSTQPQQLLVFPYLIIAEKLLLF